MTRLSRCAMALLAAFPGAALADATVTACASDAEGPGVTLAQAMATGGVIRFQCPANTVIRATRRYALAGPTRVDGGDRVTLDGGGMAGALFDAGGHKLTLARIGFRSFKGIQGPLVPSLNVSVARGADLELDTVTIDASESPIGVRVGGTLAVANSMFRGNSGVVVNAGADATAYVAGSNFIDNGQALIMSRGEVRRTSFTAGRDGAVTVFYPSGRVVIRNCMFRQNKGKAALRMTQRSARDGAALVSLRSNVFDGNEGEVAGAISIYDSVVEAPAPERAERATRQPARFESEYDRFRDNKGGMAGAIDAQLGNTRGFGVTAGLFVGNQATYGAGAISAAGGPLAIRHSLFKRNAALHQGSQQGAAVRSADAPVVMANSLVVENEGGSAAVSAPAATLLNVTVAANRVGGLAVWDAAASSRVANSIFAGNSGSNCSGVSAAALAGAKNAQWGAADCPGARLADPGLDTYYIPAPGNFALTEGDPAVCLAPPVGGKDVVFSLRATNPGSCALGAYEHVPLRKFRVPREEPQK